MFLLRPLPANSTFDLINNIKGFLSGDETVTVPAAETTVEETPAAETQPEEDAATSVPVVSDIIAAVAGTDGPMD